MYHFKGPTKDIDFIDFIDAATLFDDIKSEKIGSNKSNKQLSEIENITKFYKSREEFINFYNDYFKMTHKAAYDSKHCKGLKILTPKQMLRTSKSR